MSAFKALNIESDDESDIEVDDTKELQIEDALKLYQNALKYHAQGPESYDLAAEAYQQLFQSEIFKYPESQPELRRIELYGPIADLEDVWDEGPQSGTVVAVGGLDAGPSTLPQLLHLSHKNYGQFNLQYLTARLEKLNLSLTEMLREASFTMNQYVEALDKDDTDIDLWRHTASVGEMLDSKRVVRFCLETVLEGDDEGVGGTFTMPGLEEAIASERLRSIVGDLNDRVFVMQSQLWAGKRKALSKALRRQLEVYREVTDRIRTLRSEQDDKGPPPTRTTLRPVMTWGEVANEFNRQQSNEKRGLDARKPALAIAFDVGSEIPAQVKPAQTVSVPRIELPKKSPPFMPTNITEQFPGLDGGQPTVQPQIAPASESLDITLPETESPEMEMKDSESITLPTRKRSGDEAGLKESVEEGRAKSKRTRNTRDSNAVEDTRQAQVEANIRWEFEQHLNEIQAADDWMFETIGNLFERIGIVGLEEGRNVRGELQGTESEDDMTSGSHDSDKGPLSIAKSDLHAFLNAYSDQLAYVLIVGGESLDNASQGSNSKGFGGSLSTNASSRAATRPPPISHDGVVQFLQEINEGWYTTPAAVWKWLERLLQPQGESGLSSYRCHTWPYDQLKTVVVNTLVNFDEDIYKQASLSLEKFQHGDIVETPVEALAEMLETVFELHLDVFCMINQPNTGVGIDAIASQSDRLQRWAGLAREVLHHRSMSVDIPLQDELSLRFFWTTTFNVGATYDVSQDHVIECMNDLRKVLVAANGPAIHLHNNAIMPEVSVAALDRELSRLTTRDFFAKVTNQDQNDPVAVIESLEPLLAALGEPFENKEMPEEVVPSAGVSQELVQFLQGSDLSTRLDLWQRLRAAYHIIDYQPMEISCYFSTIQVVLKELKATLSANMAQADRQVVVLKSLRLVAEMVNKVCDRIANCENAFECVDERVLKLSVTALGEILQLLQVFNVFGDSLRVGQSQTPALANGLPKASFGQVMTVINEMQVRVSMLLYVLFKEAIFQFSDLFPNHVEDKFDFLRTTHRNLGLRGICGGCNRTFIRLLKDEFLHMTHVEGYESEQAQVLYDLHGLNCFLNPSYELMDHNCTHDAFFDRGSAMQAIDLLILQASKLPTKDLVKHTIKDTIDKVHGAAPRKKPTDAILRNREVLRDFLKSAINPLDLYDCLRGLGAELPYSPVPREDAPLAAKGWFFLIGHIALTKFRSQKRTAATPTEDVDIAIAFFTQALEYSFENWATWFRLAQAYDTKIEEMVVWSAEKLNGSMPDLVQLQRQSIHCYTMATMLANRSPEMISDKMTELCSDFANRLYASSREPFSMKPFEHGDATRLITASGNIDKSQAFPPMRLYTTWKLARTLFKKALRGKPDVWMLHYMLGKCSWKMHTAPPDLRTSHDVPPTALEVLDSFTRAIELVPEKKDSKEKREPVLEPHYKLVSVVHKMVSRGSLDLSDAEEALRQTCYAKKFAFPDEMDEWVPYILSILKKLRAADKSNWYHRMVARSAQIVYDNSESRTDSSTPDQESGVISAKQEFTQHMFTRTMVLNIWRPDLERAGRHFVYTARYTRLILRILEQLGDRESMAMLSRRVRRRPHEIFEYNLVWQDLCNTYLRMLRAHAGVAEGFETSTFSAVQHEDYLVRRDLLQTWMQGQADPPPQPPLAALREAVELKRTNSSLMKSAPIDDLIGDIYAHLYTSVGKDLVDNNQQRVKQEEPPESSTPKPSIIPAFSPPRNPTMSLSHLMNLDGAGASTVGPSASASADPSRQHTPALHQTTLTAPSASTAPAAPTGTDQNQPVSRRKVGVGRREIRTAADGCFLKTSVYEATQAAAAGASGSAHRQSNTRVQVVIHTGKVGAGEASRDTSAPGSVHDSADDESELSELEEESGLSGLDEGDAEDAGREVVFPGLVGGNERREDRGERGWGWRGQS